jgi:molecular chaperone GrpE
MKDQPRPDDLNEATDQAPDEETQSGEPDNGAAEEQTPEFLMRTLESVRKERDDYYDLLLRKQAEFENFRKRSSKDKEEARLSALADIIRELLPVVDAAEKGLESLKNEAKEARVTGYREGYELLLKNMRSVLEKFGVKELSSVGNQFDPSIHEAVLTEATDQHEEGSVIEEYRKGYMISDRLLRAAQVKVAVPSGESSA